MHDFDERREERATADREFKLGGEVFVRRSGIRPERMTDYEDLTPQASSRDALKVIDNLILSFLEPDGHDRYLKLREREEDPLTVSDLNDLVRWLISETTGRPTRLLSLSTPGPEQSGTPSTATSSSGSAEVSTG